MINKTHIVFVENPHLNVDVIKAISSSDGFDVFVVKDETTIPPDELLKKALIEQELPDPEAFYKLLPEPTCSPEKWGGQIRKRKKDKR